MLLEIDPAKLCGVYCKSSKSRSDFEVIMEAFAFARNEKYPFEIEDDHADAAVYTYSKCTSRKHVV